MNSIHRMGLTIAGVATALTVAGAFVAQGYSAAQQARAQSDSATTAVTIAATPTLPPQIFYVNPAPTPAAPPAAQPAPVIHVVVPGFGDDGGSDH